MFLNSKSSPPTLRVASPPSCRLTWPIHSPPPADPRNLLICPPEYPEGLTSDGSRLVDVPASALHIFELFPRTLSATLTTSSPLFGRPRLTTQCKVRRVESGICSKLTLYQNLTMDATRENSAQGAQTSSTKPQDKTQPWRSIWPAPRESQPQAQIFGFKKGEVMVFDGNAGNFFAKEGWKVEQESSN